MGEEFLERALDEGPGALERLAALGGASADGSAGGRMLVEWLPPAGAAGAEAAWAKFGAEAGAPALKAGAAAQGFAKAGGWGVGGSAAALASKGTEPWRREFFEALGAAAANAEPKPGDERWLEGASEADLDAAARGACGEWWSALLAVTEGIGSLPAGCARLGGGPWARPLMRKFGIDDAGKAWGRLVGKALETKLDGGRPLVWCADGAWEALTLTALSTDEREAKRLSEKALLGFCEAAEASKRLGALVAKMPSLAARTEEAALMEATAGAAKAEGAGRKPLKA